MKRAPAFVSLFLLACGGSGPTSTGAPTILTFTATPAALPEGGGMVTLSWSTSGATVWELLPMGLHVSADGQQTLSVSASARFVLVASTSTTTALASADVVVAAAPPVPSVVRGRVLDEGGAPVVSARVAAPDGGVLVTDAAGVFSFPAPPQPFDLLVVDASGASGAAYLGVTRMDPAVVLGGLAPVHHSGPVHGTLLGGLGFPLPSTVGARALLQGPGFESVEYVVDPATGEFSGPPVDWFGASTLQLTVLGTQRDLADYYYGTDSSGYLKRNRATGSQAVSTTDGQPLAPQLSLTTVDLVGTQFSSPDIEVVVTAPTGYGPVGGDLTEVFRDGSELNIWRSDTTLDLRNYYFHPVYFATSFGRFQATAPGPAGERVWSAAMRFDSTTPEVVNTWALPAAPTYDASSTSWVPPPGFTTRVTATDSNGRVHYTQVGDSTLSPVRRLAALGWRGVAGGSLSVCALRAGADDFASSEILAFQSFTRAHAGGCAADAAVPRALTQP